MTEDAAFPPKVNWSDSFAIGSGSTIGGDKQCYSVKRVKDNYLVESPEDDNKLAVANDFQEKDVEAWELIINVNNGGKFGTLSPSSITIQGCLGTIKYDYGDSETIEWAPNVNGIYESYAVSSNKVTFPTAYVVRDVGELVVDTEDLNIEVNYENGASSSYTGSDIKLLNKFNKIILTVGSININPDIPLDTGLTPGFTGLTSTSRVILRYDFSNIVGNGTTLYQPNIYSVYYNTTGNITEINSTAMFTSPQQITSSNATLECTLGEYAIGSDIYLWLVNEDNYCGKARTSMQITANNLINLENELTNTPRKYTIPTSARSTYYITIYVNKV